jgi:diaminohydroxyphosphoribosylaminopyrimidine deaminase/5-amino-6-(5-phosphoribosylamino)uracil reductase
VLKEPCMLKEPEYQAMTEALELAKSFRGATSPNPPVAGAALDEWGVRLSLQAHAGAGTPHAEPLVLRDCRERGVLERIHTLLVTLEPCNHHGRTPPCSDAIIQAGIKRVIYAVKDPNPKVAGHGAEALARAGIEVVGLDASPEHPLVIQARELISPFSHWATTGLPWVTLKTAWNREGSMIPPPGQKTFTSEGSLQLAHRLRRQADAILTGSGTVLADQPEFTVRNVPDHPGKRRWLVILDRRARVPEAYLSRKREQGFEVIRHAGGIRPVLEDLGAKGAHEVLIEAGPTLASHILHEGLWNQHYMIRQRWDGDQIEVVHK